MIKGLGASFGAWDKPPPQAPPETTPMVIWSAVVACLNAMSRDRILPSIVIVFIALQPPRDTAFYRAVANTPVDGLSISVRHAQA